MMKRILLSAMVVLMAMGAVALAKDSASERAQAMVDRGIDFMKSQQQADGGWQTGPQPPAITAVVVRGIVEGEKFDGKTDFVEKGDEKLVRYQMENSGEL